MAPLFASLWLGIKNGAGIRIRNGDGKDKAGIRNEVGIENGAGIKTEPESIGKG